MICQPERVPCQTTKMCDECKSYMEEGFTHGLNACPLLQAAYCSYCTINGHYMSKCPNRPKRRVRNEAIPSVTPPPPSKPLAIIGHNNLTYMEYLAYHGMEPKLKLDENKELVKKHLAKRGHELAESQMPPATKHSTK